MIRRLALALLTLGMAVPAYATTSQNNPAVSALLADVGAGRVEAATGRMKGSLVVDGRRVQPRDLANVMTRCRNTEFERLPDEPELAPDLVELVFDCAREDVSPLPDYMSTFFVRLKVEGSALRLQMIDVIVIVPPPISRTRLPRPSQ